MRRGLLSIIKDKKADLISAELKSMKGEGKPIEEIASKVGVKVLEATQVNFRSYSVSGAGVEPALIGAGSIAEQGVVNGPVKGNNGVYLISVNNVATAAGEDIKLLKDRLMSTFQMRSSYEAYEALKKNANVVDKRYKFY
jgi:peptidyl-prolyl cis-trans isomerase D